MTVTFDLRRRVPFEADQDQDHAFNTKGRESVERAVLLTTQRQDGLGGDLTGQREKGEPK